MHIPETPLYKFFSNKSSHFEDTMKNLAEGRLWFSGIENLNDPWEGIAPLEDSIPQLLELLAQEAGYSDVGVGNIKDAPEKMLQMIRKKGIYSCSSIINDRDPRRNKLLWSHYGNEGRGVCVEFRRFSFRTLPSSKVGIFHDGNIQYRDEMKTIEKAALDFLFPGEGGAERLREFVDLALFQKPKSWRYEDEYRFISDAVGYVPLDSCPVSAIYFGPRMEADCKSTIVKIFSTVAGVISFDTVIDGYDLKITAHKKSTMTRQ